MTGPPTSPRTPPRTAGRIGHARRTVAVAVVAIAVMLPALLWNPVALGVGLVGAAVSLRLWRLLRRVRSTADAPLATLMNLIEVRDGVSSGHAYRVALVARALAESSGCGRPELERIARAASLHNIGSLAIAPGLLTSPTPLTLDQEREIARHTVIGAEALSASVSARELVPVVRHHHERWDGAGYPDGLAGEQIPLGARIVAVADTAVAVRSARPYRDALDIDAVVAVLRDGASRQWDPRLVDRLVTLVALGHPPVVTGLEIAGSGGGAYEPGQRLDPVAQGSTPWTGPPRLGREPFQPSAAPPTPIGAGAAVDEREVVAHE